MQLNLRPATIDDCPALGLVIVTASLKTFLGQIPEEDFDFAWTPEVSAHIWHEYFTNTAPPGEFFVVAEVDQRSCSPDDGLLMKNADATFSQLLRSYG